MRYTTARFGETVYLLGEFVSGLALGTVTMRIVDLATDSLITLSDNQCTEVSNTSFGASVGGTPPFPGFSTYTWPTSNITTPSLVDAQYLYIMEDTSTGRVQKGKFTVGGHPDASAVSRYAQEVDITPTGTALLPIGTMGANGTLAFTAGSPSVITRTVGGWAADGFVVGDYIQITGATLNNGVFGPILSITGGDQTLNLTNGVAIQTDTDAGTEVIISKNFEYDVGSREKPAANLLDANLIAQVLKLNSYHLRNGMALTVDFPHDNWIFLGDDPDADIVTFEGNATNDGSTFTSIGIRGLLAGRIITTRCIIGEFLGTVDGLEGVLNDTGTAGTLKIATGGTVSGLQVAARDLNGTILDYINGGSPKFLVGSFYGLWSVIRMVNAAAVFGIAANGAVISIANTCTDGTIRIGGVGELNVQNGTAATVINELVRGSKLDENVSDIVAFVS